MTKDSRNRSTGSGYDMMRLAFSSPPIAFHRELSLALGGIYEALLFQQLAYWSDKGTLPGGWIYKTGAELSDETTMNRYQLDKARANLVRLGVIKAERRGVPATMHYLVVWEALYELLRGPEEPENGVDTQFVEGQQTSLSKVSIQFVEGQQTGLSKVSKQDRSRSANSNKEAKDYAETTQRNGAQAEKENVTEAIRPEQFHGMKPEDLAARFEADRAMIRSLPRLR